MDYIELTFISEFKRIKIWKAICYKKKSKLVIFNKDLEKNCKLDVQIYLNEILNRKFFDF